MAHHAVLLPLILCTPLVSPNYLLPSSPLFGEPMVCLQEGRTRCWPLLLPPALWPFWGCSGLRNLIIDPPPPDPTAVDTVPFRQRHDAARPLVDAPPSIATAGETTPPADRHPSFYAPSTGGSRRHASLVPLCPQINPKCSTTSFVYSVTMPPIDGRPDPTATPSLTNRLILP